MLQKARPRKKAMGMEMKYRKKKGRGGRKKYINESLQTF